MSFYNLLNGVNPAALFFLPMLGLHPDEYPRFRDCFLEVEEQHILVFTRTGGNNREWYVDAIDAMYKMPTFITDYDDEDDETYAYFVFGVPEQWVADYQLIVKGNFTDASPAYREEMCRVYPKLKEKIEEFFSANYVAEEVEE